VQCDAAAQVPKQKLGRTAARRHTQTRPCQLGTNTIRPSGLQSGEKRVISRKDRISFARIRSKFAYSQRRRRMVLNPVMETYLPCRYNGGAMKRTAARQLNG